MKANRHILLLVILVLLAVTLHAAEPPKNDDKLKFWDRFHLWQNPDTKKEFAQPAFFQLTFPDEGEKLLTIGIGIKFDLVNNTSMDLGFFADYSRNTQIDKEQDVLKAGMVMEWQLFKVDIDHSSHSPILIAKINYKRDGIKDTGSLQTVIAYTHMFKAKQKSKQGSLLPNAFYHPKLLHFTYSPFIGLEYENVISSGTDGINGDVLRAYFQLEAALYPLGDKLRRRLELASSYIYRRDITNSISEKNMTYRLLKTGISYYFLPLLKKSDKKEETKEDENKENEKNNILLGVGITYVNGEDPSIGLEKQKYLQIGLKLKVN